MVLLAALVGAVVGAEAGEPAGSPTYHMTLQQAWIEMPDGVRLAADLYLPVPNTANTHQTGSNAASEQNTWQVDKNTHGAAIADGTSRANANNSHDIRTDRQVHERFPVLLEYLPYRKDESRDRNYRLYAYFVERGYVVARVDIRGTGNSEGRLVPYEYSDQEWADGDAIIDWLAQQSWSTGNIGMFGISWGGFNAIQMAGRGHPALKTIIAVDATEDLYQEDVHYIDGIMHLDSWEMSQELYNAMPGAPDYVIDDALFEDRFDTEPWVLSHKRQQRDGPYWDRASWRDRHHTIAIPSFHIGGWYDGYRDSVPRMLARVTAPVKGMIGPWSHAFPHDPYPQPGMEWRHEAVRWFDHWLKGIDTGIMAEPRFAVYVRDWHPPGPYLEEVPGYWRWEQGWPIERTEHRTLYPQPNRTLWMPDALSESSTASTGTPDSAGTPRSAGGPDAPTPDTQDAPGAPSTSSASSLPSVPTDLTDLTGSAALSAPPPGAAVHALRNLPTTGVEASGPVMWWGDVAPDQRPTDAFSLVYDSEPLSEATEILGFPTAHLAVAADATRANWFARLSDIAPDGTVTQVAGAGFNGTHRLSARAPQDLVPGEFFPLDIQMHFTSWVFPAGHRIRLSISNAQWPMFWPTPYPLTTALRIGGTDGSRLSLPVIPGGTDTSARSLAVTSSDPSGVRVAPPVSPAATAVVGTSIGGDYSAAGTGSGDNRSAEHHGAADDLSGEAEAEHASQHPAALTTTAARDAIYGTPSFLPPVDYPGAPGFATLDGGTSSGYGEISSVDRNPQTGEVTVKATNSGGTRYPWGVETYRETIEHRTSDSQPENTSMLGTHLIQVELPGRILLFEAELDFRSDAENFYYTYFRRLTENDVLIREKHWRETIPRDFQ